MNSSPYLIFIYLPMCIYFFDKLNLIIDFSRIRFFEFELMKKFSVPELL